MDMTDHSQEARLQRIENKLDKLSEAFTILARVEEKIMSSNTRIDRLEFRADESERDMDKIKGIVGYNQQTVRQVERFAWILVSSLVGTLMYFFK
jgi:cob(I)alamin adenosyltransferase